MKLDAEIKGEVMKNTRRIIGKMVDLINDLVDNSASAKYADQLMDAKQEIMSTLVIDMPLGSGTCYFCQIDRIKKDALPCDNCEYANVHGKCRRQVSNDFQRIMDTRSDLINAISKYHSHGTKYRSFYIFRERIKPHAHYMYMLALRAWRSAFFANIYADITDMNTATTVEEFMLKKQILLKDLIRRIPKTGRYCYFCQSQLHAVKQFFECRFCAYAHKHRQCNNSDSDWRMLITAVDAMLESLDKYYSGETYGPPDTPAPPRKSRKDIPNPGSDEARAQGCVCPVIDNDHGAGFGGGLFWINQKCPVHGEETHKKE